MATYDGEIRINTKINNDGFNRGVSDIRSNLAGLTNALGRVAGAVGIGFAVDKVVQFGKEAINAGAELSAMNAQFEQVFGNLSTTASKSLASIAKEAGYTSNALKGSYTSIAAFGKTAGMSMEQSMSLADRATKAAVDSAAFYDRSIEETMENLRSYLKGNFENDAALGLSSTETTRNAAAMKLYGKEFKKLTETQKQFTLLAQVEEANKLSGALGQAARESGEWTAQTAFLRQSLQDVMATAGQGLIALLSPALQGLNSIVSGLMELANMFKGFAEQIAAANAGVDLEPMRKSAVGLWAAFKRLATVVGGILYKAYVKVLKPLAEFALNTAAPIFLNRVADAFDTIYGILKVLEPILDVVFGLFERVIGAIGRAINAVKRFFGMEPDTDLTEAAEETAEATEGAADAGKDLADSADDAADKSKDAGDSIGKANDAANKAAADAKNRDVLGFDKITKLSDTSSSSGGSGGSGGTGGSGGKKDTDKTGSGSTSTGGTTAPAATGNPVNLAPDEYTSSLGAIEGAFDLIAAAISRALDGLSALFSKILEGGGDIIQGALSGLGKAIENALSGLGADRTETTTLKLVKADGFDALLAIWNGIKGGAATKNLTLDETDTFSKKKKVWEAIQDARIRKLLHLEEDDGFTGSGGKWDSIHDDKAKKTLTLYEDDGFTGTGGKWESIKDKVVKGLLKFTFLDEISEGLMSIFQGLDKEKVVDTLLKFTFLDEISKMLYETIHGVGGSTGSRLVKTVFSGVADSTWNMLSSAWNLVQDQAVTKTAKGAQAGSFDSTKKAWDAVKNTSVSKTIKGYRSGSFNGAKGAWDSIKSAWATKTIKGTKTGTFVDTKSRWDSLKSKKVTATVGFKKSSIKIKQSVSGFIRTIGSLFTAFATGGVVNGPTLGMIGEAGKEAVVPLKNNTEWTGIVARLITQHMGNLRDVTPRIASGCVVNQAALAMAGAAVGREMVSAITKETAWMDTLANKLAAKLDERTIAPNGQTITVQCVLDGQVVASNTVRHINQQARATGQNPLTPYL